MTDNHHDSNSELDLEVATGAEQETAVNEDTEGSQESSSEPENLDFLDESDKSEKEKARRKSLEGQINAAKKKIQTKADFDSQPDYIREELVKQGFEIPKSKKKEEVQLDEEAIVQKAVERLKEEQAFTTMKQAIQSMDLTSQEVTDLRKEYETLRDSGLSQTKSLQTAMRLTGISEERLAEHSKDLQLARMTLSPSGKPQTMRKREVSPMDLSGDDFLKWSDNMGGNKKPIYR